VVSILLLLSVIFAALVGLPKLWWPRRNGIPQFGFSGPQGRTTTRRTAAESIRVLRALRARPEGIYLSGDPRRGLELAQPALSIAADRGLASIAHMTDAASQYSGEVDSMKCPRIGAERLPPQRPGGKEMKRSARQAGPR
jgi:hypothetical protein